MRWWSNNILQDSTTIQIHLKTFAGSLGSSSTNQMRDSQIRHQTHTCAVSRWAAATVLKVTYFMLNLLTNLFHFVNCRLWAQSRCLTSRWVISLRRCRVWLLGQLRRRSLRPLQARLRLMSRSRAPSHLRDIRVPSLRVNRRAYPVTTPAHGRQHSPLKSHEVNQLVNQVLDRPIGRPTTFGLYLLYFRTGCFYSLAVPPISEYYQQSSCSIRRASVCALYDVRVQHGVASAA